MIDLTSFLLQISNQTIPQVVQSLPPAPVVVAATTQPATASAIDPFTQFMPILAAGAAYLASIVQGNKKNKETAQQVSAQAEEKDRMVIVEAELRDKRDRLKFITEIITMKQQALDFFDEFCKASPEKANEIKDKPNIRIEQFKTEIAQLQTTKLMLEEGINEKEAEQRILAKK